METAMYILIGALVGAGIALLVAAAHRAAATTTALSTTYAHDDTADRAMDIRVALEDPAPPENLGPSEGSRLWVYRDTQSRIVGVERRRWPGRAVAESAPATIVDTPATAATADAPAS